MTASGDRTEVHLAELQRLVPELDDLSSRTRALDVAALSSVSAKATGLDRFANAVRAYADFLVDAAEELGEELDADSQRLSNGVRAYHASDDYFASIHRQFGEAVDDFADKARSVFEFATGSRR